MKNILLSIILICIFTNSSSAQISAITPVEKPTVVGLVKSGGYTLGELSYTLDEGDSLYTLKYYNREYKQLVDYQYIRFSADQEVLNTLYNALKSVFLPENAKNKDYKLEFKLGETIIIVGTYRSMGITMASLFALKGWTYYTEKQVDKLFGK